MPTAKVATAERQDADFERLRTLGEIGLDHFTPYLINRISHRWNIDLREKLKRHGLTTQQMRVLAVLSVMSGLTVNELAVFTIAEQSTMSRTLDAMESQGLIRRALRDSDARVREIFVTERGDAKFREVWPPMFEYWERMLGGIDATERQAFIATLQKVLTNIRKHDF